ncbi:MAG: flavodoxin, partial [Lachnospiraceae bacterium]|nr:flavodoxin [Lachnospiraceae bacterium]
VPYRDEVYPFLQCSRKMPDVSEIQEILDLVAKEKPLCIVTIGGNSIVSDLCSRIVPTIVVSTVPSGRVQTRGQFQAIGRRPGEADFAWAGKHHLPKEHFIESVFTSSFKKQEHSYTRQDLELPENGFIAAMVGGRLSDEVDGKCMDMLEKLMAQGIYVAFIGGFWRFEEFRRTDALFAKYAIDMGKQDDVLAVLECMDLYMNPKRIGGGTSVAEALYKGVPVVTLDYGDGGLGAGEDFFVKDYEDMHETVLRYAKDKEFYSEMSKKAKERAAILTNSEKEFVRLMNTAMSRDAFQ